jgi:hypothetical protein
MPLWRRLIAVLLLLAFVPGSTLAAMPLVWCVGENGHRAIEYAASPATSHIDHLSLGSPTEGALEAADHGCQDLRLMGQAKMAKAPTGGLLTFDLRNVIELPTTPAAQFPTCDRLWSSYSSAPPVPDPQRIALRCVVLLI